jgi:hypothetical protein
MGYGRLEAIGLRQEARKEDATILFRPLLKLITKASKSIMVASHSLKNE